MIGVRLRKVKVLADIIGSFRVDFEVKYSKITWTTSGKRTRHSVVVKAETKSEAIKKVLDKTKGLAFNIRVEELKDEV